MLSGARRWVGALLLLPLLLCCLVGMDIMELELEVWV